MNADRTPTIVSGQFGRRVDLNTRGFLSRYFRDQVEAEALPVYEADVLDNLLSPPQGP
jgi:hypothetical protein